MIIHFQNALTGVILAVCLPLLSANSTAKYPINVWLTNCMEKNPSIKGLNACLGQAYEKWDLELASYLDVLKQQ